MVAKLYKAPIQWIFAISPQFFTQTFRLSNILVQNDTHCTVFIWYWTDPLENQKCLSFHFIEMVARHVKEDIKYDFVKFWIIGLQKLLLKSLDIDSIMKILLFLTSGNSAVVACLLSKCTICSSNPAKEGFYLNWLQSKSRFLIHIFKILPSHI